MPPRRPRRPRRSRRRPRSPIGRACARCPARPYAVVADQEAGAGAVGRQDYRRAGRVAVPQQVGGGLAHHQAEEAARRLGEGGREVGVDVGQDRPRPPQSGPSTRWRSRRRGWCADSPAPGRGSRARRRPRAAAPRASARRPVPGRPPRAVPRARSSGRSPGGGAPGCRAGRRRTGGARPRRRAGRRDGRALSRRAATCQPRSMPSIAGPNASTIRAGIHTAWARSGSSHGQGRGQTYRRAGRPARRPTPSTPDARAGT